MPLPLAPLGPLLLRAAALGAVAWTVSRMVAPVAARQETEDALDRVHEGVAAGRPRGRPGQVNAEARWRRVVRLGQDGPGVEIDLTALGRLRVRRV